MWSAGALNVLPPQVGVTAWGRLGRAPHVAQVKPSGCKSTAVVPAALCVGRHLALGAAYPQVSGTDFEWTIIRGCEMAPCPRRSCVTQNPAE